MKTKKNIFCSFFKYTLDNKDGADKFKLNEVRKSNLINSDCRAWALKLSRHFQKKSIKIRPKRTLFRRLKRTMNQCQIPYTRKIQKKNKNVSICTINVVSVVFETRLLLFEKQPYVELVTFLIIIVLHR